MFVPGPANGGKRRRPHPFAASAESTKKPVVEISARLRFMGNTTQSCSLCRAPDSVREYIEKQVAARVKLKTLELETGVDDSIISRHMRRCVPQREARSYKKIRALNMAGRRVICLWPDDSMTVQPAHDTNPRQFAIRIEAKEIIPHDFVMRVVFEPEVPPRNSQSSHAEAPPSHEVDAVDTAGSSLPDNSS
jgi:hypothetical protein